MQTAIGLLALEMARKSEEDAQKKAKADAEKDRIEELHRRHLDAEEELKKESNDLEELINRIDERLLLIEEQLMDIRQHQTRKRWF